MKQLFSNNIDTTLADAISDSATEITLEDASGLSEPAGNDFEFLTITDGTHYEIVSVQSRAGNVLTLGWRGLEGTTARTWAAGARVFAGVTAGTLAGFQMHGTGLGSVAIGINATADGDESIAVGDHAQAVGVGSIAVGGLSVARPDRVVNFAGLFAALSADDADGTWGDNYDAFWVYGAPGVVVLSLPVDLAEAGTIECPVPEGVTFYPDEVGLIVYEADDVTVQPEISFGADADPEALLADVQTTGLTAAGHRQRFTTLLSAHGQTDLTFTVATAATADTLTARAYWRGFAVQDDPA